MANDKLNVQLWPPFKRSGTTITQRTASDDVSLNAGVIKWSVGKAVTAADYSITRDLDATNQLHFNVPTGSGFEWSINDVPRMTMDSTGMVRTQGVATSGSPTMLTLTAGAHTTLANADLTEIFYNIGRTIQFTGGAGPVTITNYYGQRTAQAVLSTAGAGALTVSDAYGQYINPPTTGAGGGGTTITRAWASGFNGNIGVGAGTVSLPSISFLSDSDTGIYSVAANSMGITTGGNLRLLIGTTTYIPTPATNKFVVGGTAVIGNNSVANFISDSSSYEPISIQNTAVTGWSQLDIYDNTGTSVGGFGYGNASAAVQASKTYFYTIAKDFHISTDSNVTRHFLVAATNGRATFTNTVIAGTTGVTATITGSGSAVGALSAAKFTLSAGYTGGSGSFGVYAQNQTAGTATDEFSNVQAANYGEYIATTTGTVVGQAGYASGGDKSYGGFFRSIVTKASSKNIGIGGFASNGANVEIGGFFGLMSTAPTYASSALIADNGVTTNPIFLARDNGVAVLTIADGGASTLATTATSGGLTAFTITQGAHTAVTAQQKIIDVSNHTLTVTGNYVAQVFNNFGTNTITAASGITLTNVYNGSFSLPTTAGSAILTNIAGVQVGTAIGGTTTANAASSTVTGLTVSASTVTLSTTTQVTSACGIAGIRVGGFTVNQSGGAVTVDNSASLYISSALTAGASVNLTNNYALFVDDGPSRFDDRILGFKGADVASASGITLTKGNFFDITGTTQINTISSTGWTAGSVVVLRFNGNVTVTHNSGGTNDILLASSANFSATAGDTLSLVFDGTDWNECSRTVI